MKVFQVIGGFCHWDATAVFPTAEATVGRFPPTDLFVDAPDYVFEGWGYDPSREDPFVKPETPDGWVYDDATGTFYREGDTPPMTDGERIAALEEALAQTDEAAIELFEATEEQQEINAAQDEALIEIYEMIGG